MADGAPVVVIAVMAVIAGIVTIIIRVIPVIAIIAVGPVIPGIVIPGTVIPIPVVIPGVVIPRVIEPGIVPPGAVTPGAVITPGTIVPGAVVIIVPEIPGAVCKGIVPCPAWRIFHGNEGIILVKADGLACGDNQRVASAQDINFGRPAVCKKIVQLILGNGRHLVRHGAGIDAIVVGLGLKPAYCGAGQGGKRSERICHKSLFHRQYLLLSNKNKYLCAGISGSRNLHQNLYPLSVFRGQY
jgi:hypothetical protein